MLSESEWIKENYFSSKISLFLIAEKIQLFLIKLLVSHVSINLAQ